MSKKEFNQFGLTSRDMSTFRDIFGKYPDVKKVEVFGSRAKGTFRLGSDVDLAIMNKGVEDKDVINIKYDFEDSSLPYRVDLINYHTLKHSDLLDHIKRVGVVFYEA